MFPWVFVCFCRELTVSERSSNFCGLPSLVISWHFISMQNMAVKGLLNGNKLQRSCFHQFTLQIHLGTQHMFRWVLFSRKGNGCTFGQKEKLNQNKPLFTSCAIAFQKEKKKKCIILFRFKRKLVHLLKRIYVISRQKKKKKHKKTMFIHVSLCIYSTQQ